MVNRESSRQLWLRIQGKGANGEMFPLWRCTGSSKPWCRAALTSFRSAVARERLHRTKTRGTRFRDHQQETPPPKGGSYQKNDSRGGRNFPPRVHPFATSPRIARKLRHNALFFRNHDGAFSLQHVCMYVCIVSTFSRLWINRVRLTILVVVS